MRLKAMQSKLDELRQRVQEAEAQLSPSARVASLHGLAGRPIEDAVHKRIASLRRSCRIIEGYIARQTAARPAVGKAVEASQAVGAKSAARAAARAAADQSKLMA